ncbi:unnamed protein product [Caenorhabditis angaria]|uniref:Uncharacterized protein n=1 Tax=Caenorhabditis angaria TaxID=860376 RepID=A0A9P1ILT7_9PELO|nr:unnamed protein product [Caenorhabditis angaria]
MLGLLLIASLLGVLESVDILLQTDAMCGLNTHWCAIEFVLEHDKGIGKLANYDLVKIFKRKCSDLKHINFAYRFNLKDGDGYISENRSYELHIGFRHNCTKDGAIYDYIASKESPTFSQKKLDISYISNVQGQGAEYERNRYKAWRRTKFTNLRIESLEGFQFEVLDN